MIQKKKRENVVHLFCFFLTSGKIEGKKGGKKGGGGGGGWGMGGFVKTRRVVGNTITITYHSLYLCL